MRSVRSIRLSEEESKLIQAAAALVAIPQTVFLRAAGLAAATTIARRAANQAALHPEARLYAASGPELQDSAEVDGDLWKILVSALSYARE